MYSVEDLLISHGYKLPKHTTSSTPTPVPASSSHQPSSSSPPSYTKHQVLENRHSSRTVNGYERGPVVAYGSSSGARQPQAYGGGCPNNNNDPKDRSHTMQEGENRGQTNDQSLGETLTSDSGFCDGTRGPQASSKDVAYWRRRGQDFTVLLDYADLRDPHGGGQGVYIRPEGPQQARGQEPSAEDRQRSVQERQRWAVQAQTKAKTEAQVQTQTHAQAQAQVRSREREAALHQWRMANERKCQSLGTDEWNPAVIFGRQLSQSEGERWAQEQQRLRTRTPEGMVVNPRTKVKSQSLPRMMQPESLQYVDVAVPGQGLYRRVNGHPVSHQDLYRAPRWPEKSRPASANQLSMTPKPRFTRPPRPPSYEMHQQIRGSCEVLSGRESVISHARDRTPLPISRTTNPHLDYFAQDSGPPGYIPPPSYKRAPIMGAGHRGYGDISVDYRYRGDMFQQIQVAPDGSHWLIRHPSGSWPDPHRERSLSSQKQLCPVYSTQERPGGGVQYIPFDDPRIRHISSALGGNSLTDADKIRHIRNELPSVTVSETATDNSAFLPPPLGPFITTALADEAKQTSSSDFDNDNMRWQSDLHKNTVNNFQAPDQNCNNRTSKTQLPPSLPSSAFQVLSAASSSRQRPSSEQVFAETITQVKKIVPDSQPESTRNNKRRVSETIFCLVSVPVHTPSKDLMADQNNNEAMPHLTITKSNTFAVGLRESPNIRSKSVNEIPIKSLYSHFHTSSTSSMRNYKRAPLRKEIIDAWALQANEDKESCYAGSWPGNQYRNQETQTGSPLTVVKSPETQSPTEEQEPVQSARSMTADGGVGTDRSSSYGYPMAGQKNLNLSSNSAFSRLSLSPAHTSSPQHSQQYSSSPPKLHNRGDQQQSSPKKSLPGGAEQVTFGQFLLKPVNRRPFDVIGELETINKEMEDTISKRPTLGQCIDDLSGIIKRRPSGTHFTPGPEPGREAISLPPLHVEKPSNIKRRSKSFASAADLESMDLSGVFSRPQANSFPPTDELASVPNPDPRDNCPLSSIPPHHESHQLYRQDIPVPQESLLRNVGLTVYTETSGGPGEPTQRSLSVPSPLDHRDLLHSEQLSPEARTEPKNSSSDHNLNEELGFKVNSEGSDTSAFRSESCRSPQRDSLPTISRHTGELSFVLQDDEGDKRYALCEPLSYKNDSTIADKHLENLLIQEKANALPAEDLSNLYEVKCAKGIPENESIEERAARILGISVPVEALGVADKHLHDNQDDVDNILAEEQQSSNQETQQVVGECEQVEEEFLIVQGADMEEVKKTGSGMEQKEQEKEEKQKHSSDCSDGQHNQDTETLSVLQIPEFPPSKLTLSLPVTPDETLVLSMSSGRRKGRGGVNQQEKLLHADAVAPSTTDRTRHTELDSESKERGYSTKKCEVQDEAKREVVQQQLEQVGRKEGKEEENQDEYKNEHVKLGEEEPREENEKGEQRYEEVVENMAAETAVKSDSEQSGEVCVEVKMEEEEMELKIVEEDSEKPLDMEKDDNNEDVVRRAKTSPHAEGGQPKPKHRSRLQKPPLLPKPRSVPKREITLPLSFSSGTCSPTNMEEEMLYVSDSYDPSRVERV